MISGIIDFIIRVQQKGEKNRMEKKSVSLGIEDFKIVRKECYYVDKTLLIKDIIDSPSSSFFLIARPRRFGKSLAASMLQTFFEKTDDPYDYFSDTDIERQSSTYKDRIKKYPVVFLNFKNIISGEKNNIRKDIESAIGNEYERHGLPRPSNVENASGLLFDLTKTLYERDGQKVVVIVDEYDAPIQNTYRSCDFDDVVSFLKEIYGKAFKGNPYLEYGICFGILKLGKETLFSGLNNALIDSPFSPLFKKEHFALTEEETRLLLSYYEMENDYEKIKENYGGYNYNGEICFNPWSTLSFIRRFGRLDTYWSNTTNMSILNDMALSSFSKEIASLLNKERVEIKLSNASNYANLSENKNFFFEFLVYTGYLTIVNDLGMSKYSLTIPNEEIRSIFSEEVTSSLDREMNIDTVRDAFLSGDSEKIKEYLKRIIGTSFSYFEFGDPRNYQVLMLSLTSILFNDYLVKSEETAGAGRSDIILYPRNPKKVGMVIEIKAHISDISKKKMEQSAKIALNQIKKLEYPNRLVELGVKAIQLYGISFYKNKVCVISEAL